MVKRGQLNKVEKFFIEGNANLPVEELAEALDRSVAAVKKHLESVGQAPIEPKPPKRKETPIVKAMGRHQRGGKYVAAVMTKTASELADKDRPNRLKNKKLQAAIHKPYDE